MDKKKKILAAIIAATMLTSSMTSLAFAMPDNSSVYQSVSAELYADETVYYTDDFNTYTESGIATQTSSVQTATLGNLALGMGGRNGGGDSTLTVSTADDGNKYLAFHGGRWANSSRGPYFSFSSACNIPNFADVSEGNVLEMSFKANFGTSASMLIAGLTGAESNDADAYLSTEKNKEIISGEWLNVSICVDNAKNATLVMTDAEGKLVSSKSFTAAGDTIGKTVFFVNNTDTSIDDLKVSQKAKDTSAVTLTVTDTEGTALSGANVTIGRLSTTSDENGKVNIVVPDGSYDYEIKKDGYVATETSTGTIEVAGSAVEKTVQIEKFVYTPVPDVVTMSGGQSSLTAPKTAESASSAAYTLTVIDQQNIPITDPTVEWSISPADENVSVNNGVVTVKKGFNAGEDRVKNFTVTAKVTKNDEFKEVSSNIAISDYLFYDAGIGGSSYGSTNASVSGVEGDTTNTYIATPATATSNTITLPETVSFTPGTAQKVDFKMTQTTKIVFTFARTITFASNDGTSIAELAFVNNEVGGNPTWSSSDSRLGTVWGDITIGAWSDVSLLFKTNSEGVTKVSITVGDKTTDLGETTATDLSKITLTSAATTDRYILMKDISVDDVDVNGLDIVGEKNISQIAGKAVTSDYLVDMMVSEEGETFTWSVSPANSGVVVTPDSADSKKATVKVENATAGKYTLTVQSSAAEDKKAEFEINVEDCVPTTGEVEGPETVNNSVGDTKQYKLINLKDQFDKDVLEYYVPVWSSSDTSVATIDENTGVLTVVGKGSTVVTAKVGTKEFTKNVQIDNYSISVAPTANVEFTDLTGEKAKAIVAKYGQNNELLGVKIEDKAITDGKVSIEADNGDKVMLWSDNLLEAKPLQASKNAAAVFEDTTTVDVSSLVADEHITGYLVTTAKDGVLVEQTTVEKPAEGTTITVNTKGADSVEVSPVLTYTNVGNIPANSGLEIAIPNGSYDFTITKASTTRADVFVNGVMIANNVDQSDDGKGSREIKTGGTYTAEEIVVKGGKAVVTMYDKVSDMQTVVVKKNPSNVNRKTRVYVLGDSLVTNYYGDPTSVNEETGVPNPGNARTGWGQVLYNYFGSDINVSNLAESGNYAAGLYGNGADSSAFGGVINNAQKGDYLILECGYNDKNYSSTAGMTEAVNAMVDACRAKGITPILVTPNASKHDYKADVMYASTLRDCATAKDVMIVDLSANSYKFFSEKYGTDETANTVVGRNYQVWTDAATFDTLHSSYVGAMKFAEIVAQGIADLQAAGTTTASGENANGITINKEFKFSFVDTLDNTIEMQVKDSSGSEEVSPSPAPTANPGE